jgi:hypothetical protein
MSAARVRMRASPDGADVAAADAAADTAIPDDRQAANTSKVDAAASGSVLPGSAGRPVRPAVRSLPIRTPPSRPVSSSARVNSAAAALTSSLLW